MPIIPHFSNECWLKFKKDFYWPRYETSLLEEKDCVIVVQVNGKKRSSIMIEKDSSEDIVIKTIKRNKLIDKYIDGKKIFKTIYVKNRIINLIVK